MSSNLALQKRAYLTPQLKRGLAQHEALRLSSKFSPSLPLQSRLQERTPSLSQNACIMPSKLSQEQLSTKDGSFSGSSALSNQQQECISEEVLQINEVFKQIIAEDSKLASARRERKGYHHSYQQREERISEAEVWVGEPKAIPSEVFLRTEQKARESGESVERMNCLQGFLSEIGLFYYAVDNLILFFDAESMGEEARNIKMIDCQERTLFDIQVFTLAKPYFESKKNVLVLLHPYKAEMYQFNFKNSLEGDEKQLVINYLTSVPLPEEKPNRLYLSGKGYLYCPDNKGKIYKIDFNAHFWQVNKRELTSKRVKASAMALVKNTTKYLTTSLRSFARSVKDYTLSYFASRPKEAQVLFDEEKEIIVVLMKEERNLREVKGRYSQYFLVYDEKNSEILHTFTHQILKDEEVLLFKKLEAHSNAKYNFILLLNSGKRVLLDVQSDRLKKTTIIKQPPSNTGESSNRSNQLTQNRCFLQETLMGQVTFTNHYYLILAREASSEVESISYRRLESNEFANVYYRVNEPFGYRKRCLLQYESKNAGRTCNLPEMSRQVFYKYYELYHATDEIVQQIKVLRPIDLFYSLFQAYAHNFPQFLSAAKRVMPEVDSQHLISFCTQILVDSEGTYLYSRQLQVNLSSHRDLSLLRPQELELEEHSFKDIDRPCRGRLLEMMVDLAISAAKTSKQERAAFIVRGMMQYYAKLFRVVFSTNVNTLTSEICKIVSFVLQELRKFLFELQNFLNCDLKSSLGGFLRWVNRFWQMMILAKDIPNLPNLNLDEALVERAEVFHEHLFWFLIKECNEEVFNQFKKLIPSFITTQFTHVYRLYLEVSQLKEVEKILQVCRSHPQLPDYFISYLVKIRSIPEAILLKETSSKENLLALDRPGAYKQKMRDFYSKRTTLVEKEQILTQAQILLSEQSRETNRDFAIELREGKELQGQLKLQELIISIYHSRVVDKSLWMRVLLLCLPLSERRAEEQEVIERLNTCVLDRGFLEELVASLDDSLLQVMHTYYFHPQNFKAAFTAMAEQLFDSYKHSVESLSGVFQQELHFLVCKARVALSFEDITAILDTYLPLLVRCEELQRLLKTDRGLLSKQFFWLFSYSAEIGVDPERLYFWAVNRLSKLVAGDQMHLYLSFCVGYLILDFLPKKKEEFILSLHCEEEQSLQLKQIYTLLTA